MINKYNTKPVSSRSFNTNVKDCSADSYRLSLNLGGCLIVELPGTVEIVNSLMAWSTPEVLENSFETSCLSS